MPGKIFIVSAPSGAGKTTLVTQTVNQLSPHYSLERVITYTSRLPRAGEKQGLDYHFITETEFIEKINKGYFLEHSTVYGTYYGSPNYILNKVKEGTSYIMILDRTGAQQVLQLIPDAIMIWIYTELDSLKERLQRRGSESEEQITKRLRLAAEEFEQEKQFPLYHYHINNEKFEDAFCVFHTILKNFLTQSSLVATSLKMASGADKNEKALVSNYMAD